MERHDVAYCQLLSSASAYYCNFGVTELHRPSKQLPGKQPLEWSGETYSVMETWRLKRNAPEAGYHESYRPVSDSFQFSSALLLVLCIPVQSRWQLPNLYPGSFNVPALRWQPSGEDYLLPEPTDLQAREEHHPASVKWLWLILGGCRENTLKTPENLVSKYLPLVLKSGVWLEWLTSCLSCHLV